MIRRLFLILIPLFLTWAAYSHPALIGEYPERFPGKTLQQIRMEWEPAPQDAWSEADLHREAREMVEAWATMTSEERDKRVKRLAAENRRGDYRKRFANLAHDMTDLAAADAVESQRYLEWRVDHLNTDDGFFEAMPEGAWDEKPDAKAGRERLWTEERQREVQEIITRSDQASEALRPHWLVQAGALEFRHRRYREAEVFFQRLLEGFPQHPRAEVAALMLARLHWEEWWRVARWPVKDDKEKRRLEVEWWKAAQRYRDKYPHGRFTLDLDGWEAGYYWKNGNPEMAMKLYLAQSRDPSHPEMRRRAFQQIEWMLHDLVGVETLPWDEVAQEPLVALRIGYHLLDARSQTDLGALMQRRSGEDHRVLETLVPDLHAVRSRAKAAWALLDAALDRQSDVYAGKFAVVRETLHSWSLIARGHASVAVQMEEKPAGGAGADDFALARVFARIKAGQHAEAVRGIDAFQAQPSHSLAKVRDKQVVYAGSVGGTCWGSS